MTIDELRDMARADASLPEIELDTASLDTPKLHSKWTGILLDERKKLRDLEAKLIRLRQLLWLYYSNKMSVEDVKKLGWDITPLRVLKGEVKQFIESDDRFIKAAQLVEEQADTVEFVNSFIQELGRRNWTIRNVIEHRKFMAGG